MVSPQTQGALPLVDFFFLQECIRVIYLIKNQIEKKGRKRNILFMAEFMVWRGWGWMRSPLRTGSRLLNLERSPVLQRGQCAGTVEAVWRDANVPHLYLSYQSHS